MKVSYICPYCDQRSTRRWNLGVHIKRRHGGYLLGRSSGQHMAINPFWYKPNSPHHNIGSATVTDSVGGSFQLRYIPQQAPVGISHYYASRPPPTIEDQKHGHGLSRAVKIEELKRLMSKHPQYHENPDVVIRLAVYNSINGDNTLLDDKLEQLRTIDSLAKY